MGSDEQVPESRSISETPTPDTASDLSVGDFFPYRDGQENLKYGRITKIDRTKERPFRVRLPTFGHIWYSAEQYDTNAPTKFMDATKTAADLYTRIAEFDGR